jgi:uncharacterized membrane protein
MAEHPGDRPAIERPREAWRPADLARLVFFSDAVFAIAITLLALEIRLPDGAIATNADLADALVALGPALFAFVVSFLVIASFWVGHLREFRVIERMDGRLIALDLAFLLFIVLMPFPTSVLARHAEIPLAAVLYASFGVATGLLSTALWVYVTQRADEFAPSVPASVARAVTYRVVVVPIVFAVSIPVALLSPPVAEWSWVLIWPLQAVMTRRYLIRRDTAG